MLNPDGPSLRTVVIRHNVFDFPKGLIWIQKLKEVQEVFEISNNTSAGNNNVAFPSMVHAAPERGMIVRNNITDTSLGLGLDDVVSDIKAHENARKNWQLDHNCYLRRGAMPKSATDVMADPQFLSLDPNHPDYLHIPADSPLAKAGAGGNWPSYIAR